MPTLIVPVIDKFDGKYSWLSNFYKVPILHQGYTFPAVENAYQAAKTHDVENRERMQYLSPGDAKKMGRKVRLRPDWEDVKLRIMEELLRIKFNVPELKTKLIATKGALLVEGNWWGDTFWGQCNGKGHNYLGRLLMKIRSELT